MVVGYVIAGLVLLAILVAAYRALGRPSAPVSDPHALLRAVADTAESATAATHEPAAGARSEQRRLEGCAQALDRLTPGDLDASGARAHELLAQGVNELLWAARLLERSGLASEGLRRAHAELTTSGTRCLAQARALLAGSGAAKEGHGAR